MQLRNQGIAFLPDGGALPAGPYPVYPELDVAQDGAVTGEMHFAGEPKYPRPIPIGKDFHVHIPDPESITGENVIVTVRFVDNSGSVSGYVQGSHAQFHFSTGRSIPSPRLEIGSATEAQAAFFSYSSEDSEFALRLAEKLKAAGASVWMDQLDIEPGMPWDREVERALANCPRMLVILSPTSVNSDNVRDEVSFALNKQKRVIPVLYRDCEIPFRLDRIHYVDFRTDHARGLRNLLRALGVRQEPHSSSSFPSEVLSQTMSNPRYNLDIHALKGGKEPGWVINKFTIIIVVGTCVSAELLDRPVAERLRDRIDDEGGKVGFHRGVVITDAGWYSEESVREKSVIAVGGPVVNRLSDEFFKWAPTSQSGEGTHSMPGPEQPTGFYRRNEKGRPQVALWGEDAFGTREAVEEYIANPTGLAAFLQICWTPSE